jgi:hypothetical protein
MFTYGRRVRNDGDQPGESRDRASRWILRAAWLVIILFLASWLLIYISVYWLPGSALYNPVALDRTVFELVFLVSLASLAISVHERRKDEREIERYLAERDRDRARHRHQVIRAAESEGCPACQLLPERGKLHDPM